MSDQEKNRAEDIRDTIRAAMNGTGTEPEPTLSEPDDDEAPELEGVEPTEGRQRDERGRFAPKGGEQPEAAQHEGEAAFAQPQQDAPQVSQFAPPPGWSPQAKAEFNALPEAVKAAIAHRENEVSSGFKQYSDKAKEAQWVDNLFAPYDNQLRQSGMSREQIVRNWANAELALQRDPVSTIGWLMQQYGVTPQHFTPQQGQQPNPQYAVQQMVQPLQQQVEQLVRLQEQREVAQVEQTIQQFADARDRSGQPLYPYFHNVQDEMAFLIANDRAKDLRDAYEKACRMDPEISALLLNRTAQPATQVVAANRAKAAARSVRSSTGGSEAPPSRAPASSHHQDIKNDLWAAYKAATNG